MQRVAAYLLDRRANAHWAEVRASEAASIGAKIQDWMSSKGAKDDGTYAAEDGSHATFAMEEVEHDGRSFGRFRLTETTSTGRQFVATIFVVVTDAKVQLYATLEVGSAAAQINPVWADPRCPRVIRDVLALPGTWHHGESQLHPLRHVNGFDEGEGLAAELLKDGRSVPFVVVSMAEGQPTLPSLDQKLAFDLAGIANVCTVDEEAGWALTDVLGRRWSCFGGGVRLYWPRLRLTDDPFRHPLWTGRRLRSWLDDEVQTRERLRRQLRTRTMRAAALGVTRPREIDEIRNAAAKAAFSVRRANATSSTDFSELAESYAADNDDLRSEVLALEQAIDDLQARLGKVEAERDVLQVRLRYEGVESDPDEIPPESEDPSEPGPPGRGDIRFYKKTYSNPKRDVLVRVKDCGHNSWQGAASADKAKKGIARLEGQNDWKTIQHCGSCQGGGMWRVKW